MEKVGEGKKPELGLPLREWCCGQGPRAAHPNSGARGGPSDLEATSQRMTPGRRGGEELTATLRSAGLLSW